MARHKPILFASDNSNCDVVLIDIPASIADAQDLDVQVSSTAPLCEPLPSTEPRSEKARQKILATCPKDPRDTVYQALIAKALREIHATFSGSWTRRPERVQDGISGSEPPDRASKHRDDLVSKSEEAALARLFHDLLSRRVKLVTTTSPGSSAGAELHIWDGTFFNPRKIITTLTAVLEVETGFQTEDKALESGPSRDFVFHVPVASSFVLADCNRGDIFRNHVRWKSHEDGEHEDVFDLILLDPPWENRSVRRRSAYNTTSTFSLLDNLSLDRYLRPRGYVGIWITNKAAVRQYVLGPGGLLEKLNVVLLEEWIWVKTTLHGEPVLPLDGIWRKPYEVFLLARAPEARPAAASPAAEVKRRVIAAVPDFHSRKPCLKRLIEPYLPADYEALEVFARYLVAGWTSWGQEVLKYSWKSFHGQKMEAEEKV